MAKRKKKSRRYQRRSDEQLIAALEERLLDLRQRVRGARQFSAKAVRQHRKKLGVSAKNYAELVGVSPLTIYNWEHGRTEPRPGQLEQWLDARGFDRRTARKRIGLR